MVRFPGWRVALIAAGVFTGAGLAACGLYPDPPNIVVPPPAPPTVSTKIVGAVVNSKDASLVTQPVTLRFLTDSGAPASFVRDGNGKAVTSLTVKNGTVNLSVADGTAFPVDLVVTATGAGYLPTSATIPLTGPGQYKLIEEIASSANPPEGVTVSPPVSAGSTDASGTTSATKTVSTPDAPSAVNLTLPAGTTVTDANGAPLTGALTATVATFSAESPSAMLAVPGSLSNAVVQNNGTVSNGAMVVGGFSQIFVADAAGNQAAHFTQPLPAVLELPDTTQNPLTGASIAPGDTVPVWSFDEATGRWNNEGTATISASTTAGLLNANFSVTHLSGWAVAWFVSTAQQCNTTLNISGAGNNPLTLTVSGTGYADSFDVPAGTTQVQVSGLAPSLSVEIDALYAGQKVGSVVVNDCTAAGNLNVSITAQPATLDVSVFDVCSNGGQKTPVPSAGVVVSTGVAGSLPVIGATDATGVAHLSGFVGGSTVTVNAENRDPKGAPFAPKSVTLNAGANSVEFDNVKSCTVLTGAGGGNP